MSNEKKLNQGLRGPTVQALHDEDLHNVNGGQKSPEKIGIIVTSIIGLVGISMFAYTAVKLASTKEKLKKVNRAYDDARSKLDSIAKVARTVDPIVVYTDPVEEVDRLGGVVMGVRQILGDNVSPDSFNIEESSN